MESAAYLKKIVDKSKLSLFEQIKFALIHWMNNINHGCKPI